MSLSRPEQTLSPHPCPAHAKQHCPTLQKCPCRTKHSIFPLEKGRSAAHTVQHLGRAFLILVTLIRWLARPSSNPRRLVEGLACQSLTSTIGGSSKVPVHDDQIGCNASSRAGNSHCPTCPPPEKRVWTGQKKCPPNSFSARACSMRGLSRCVW